MDFETFMEFAKSRRSIRKFTDEKISHEEIEQLIEAASWAPSNHNRQGWKFLVFENKNQIKELAENTRQFIRNAMKNANRQLSSHSEEIVYYSGVFDQAPLIILVMHKKSPAVSKAILGNTDSRSASSEAISAAMACQNLLLAAHSMGLGGCVMTAPLLANKVWGELEDLPLGYEATCLVAVGHSNEMPSAPRRKKNNHIIEYR
jgi:coenzyme F420-0:L-glutamate ligase/coenzyme F420-1:gamma-L-glutamate ligase